MSDFRFKQFIVHNELSAMKVNTDGVLLGAAVTLDNPQDAGHSKALDVGTGTGVIALMLAQRFPGLEIDAIDIDAASAAEAADNFIASPWSERLHAFHCPLHEFNEAGYSLIVSNPPYFDDSLQNPDERKSEARHSLSLSYRSLAAKSASMLLPGGRLSVVLPADTEKALLRTLRSFGLQPVRILRIKSVPRKSPARIIVESMLCNSPVEIAGEELVISDGKNYTEEYLSLTHDFYLFA